MIIFQLFLIATGIVLLWPLFADKKITEYILNCWLKP